jgi:uncharacterized protein (UPF0147 family)
MQPYNYSIDLPAPPADNFLQNIMGIAQLQQMGQQQKIQAQQAAFQKEMQPLEMARIKAATDASNASTRLLGVQTTGAKAALADKQLISSTLQGYANDKTKTIEDLIPILPLLDTTAVENIGKAEQIRVNREVDTALKEGKEITANDIRGWSNRQTLLKGPEQQQFQQSFLAMTPQFKEAAKTGMISAVNAAFAGNMGEARKAAAEVQQALINSKDSSPASKSVSNSFGKIVDLIDQDPNLPKEVLALNVVNAAGLIGEPKLAEETLKVYKEFGDLIRPSGTGSGKGKEVDEEKRALDLKKSELDIEKERLQIRELQQKVDAGRVQKVRDFASANKEGYKLKEQADSQALQAQKALDILQTIDSVKDQLPKNIGQSLLQDIKDRVPALSNDISFLRTQYKSLIAPEAKKNLPPGSASDADMKLAREGIMNAGASPKQLRKAVEIIARETENQAKYTEAKLAWMSDNNGSVGNAKKDLDVFGSNVPKGTSLNAWWSKVGKNLDPYAMPSEASPKTGGAPSDVMNALKRAGIVK